ncbi:hypothetical protein ABXT08_19645 [Chryseobacterium sp. NRRL B-14859]|uniref:hypothetical protein n=1 Tax=unclassified Chryseobacterium TaxID=2593645 RepID=UPI0033414FFF
MKKESTHDREPLRPGTMSNALIRNLVDNYRQNHMNAIKSNLGIEDAHSIWFDLPKLKKFISVIEEEAGKINPETSEEDLGIRFYYAAYPKAEDWDIMATHPVDKEYAEKHTLVMVPTLKRRNETGEELHYDFNPLSGNKEAIAMARGLEDSDDIGIGENNGQLTPPKNSLGELY